MRQSRREDLLCGGIDFPERRVASIHHSDVSTLWLDRFRNTHHGCARFIHRLPRARTHSCQDRCTVGRTFFGFDDFNFVAVDVGLNLPPEGRSGSASA